jgi:hypothetical protein
MNEGKKLTYDNIFWVIFGMRTVLKIFRTVFPVLVLVCGVGGTKIGRQC